MNYRHAFHAGNFADVVKHAVVSRLIEYLKRKDSAFRVIDTHAGTGRYDLFSDAASRTAEWRDGIGRLLDTKVQPDAANLLEPYLDAVRHENTGGALRQYPGSPRIIRSLLRKQDRLTAIELHSEDARALRGLFAGDHQVRVIELDGWLALGAHLPPKEKRGLVLVDPPFEAPDEFERLVNHLAKGFRRWPGGLYALWYPIKDRERAAAFRSALAASQIPKILDVRFDLRSAPQGSRLDGSGMIVVNPPFPLEAELNVLLPALHGALTAGGEGGWRVEWIARDRPAA